MKKNYIYSLAATFITAALAMGSLTACSNEDIVTDTQNATQAKTYTVSIPASIGEGSKTRAVEFGNDGSTITTSFENTDKIYVALEHEGSIIGYGHTGSGSSGFMPLTVTPDAGDAKKAAISGALKFYNMNYLPPYYNPVDPSVGDLIHLYYNANSLNSDGGDISFYYSNQDGSNLNTTGAGSCDFALATMKVKSLTGNATDGYSLELCQIGDDSKSTALFENIGSMFRQHLTFKDKNSQAIAAPAIKKLTVGTKNETLVYQYDTKDNFFRTGTVDATSATSVLDANNDVYLALMFHYDANHLAADDQLVLSAEATDGNVYQAAKNVPSGGFVPGKYYHGQMELAWLKQYVKPTVTRNDTHAAIDADDEGKRFNVDTSNGGDPIDITISGSSYGYDFEINSASTVTLTGNGTATVDVNGGKFLWSSANLTVNLDGNYAINCPYNNAAISLWENLKFSGNGSLTIKVNNPDNCGLYGNNYTSSNNNHDTTTELDVSAALAAPGYKVTRSARVDNSDGSYTWTYTVAPTASKALSEVTTSEVGWRIGSNGIAYELKGLLPTGVTAVAMIGYVGDESDCTHGIAVALNDESNKAKMDLGAATTACAGKTAVTGGTWRLPSRKDWQYLFIGCGSSWTYTDSPSGSIDCSGLQSALDDAGGILMSDRYICTEGARVDFTETSASFGFTSNPWYVRAVLAF